MTKESGDSQVRDKYPMTDTEYQLTMNLFHAAQDMLKSGEHEGPCEFFSDGKCWRHLQAFSDRFVRLEQLVEEFEEVFY
jgi:hypothetical protein